MALAAGTRIGPYEIVGPLGAGGMGEVYRATDTKLERDAAIKVLPPALERDAARLARFEREAKVLAALNHPNIAVIYGLEESSGLRAIAMELVPGETLSASLKRGPMPLEDTIRIAGQIAEALEAAHDRGVTHRDLKPANVMVTPSGTVKVLDFGLAAIARPFDREGQSPENSPTLTMGASHLATEAGPIMGTAGYMSPEQAAGQPVDKRADIWSFGVVLWEMLTGQKLFSGETTSHILADVLRAPLEFDRLPPQTPPAIRNLLRRCLDRNVRTRLRDIGEARVVMQGSLLEQPVLEKPVPAPTRPPSRLPWAVAATLAIALSAATFAWYRASRPVDLPLVRLDVDLGSNVSLAPATGGSIALSPDGSRLAYVASVPGGQFKLYLRRLDQPKATELADIGGPRAPFFSPDGQWIGFDAPEKLAKISVDGGAVVPLGDNAGIGSWGDDGAIVVDQFIRGMIRIPPGGGAPTTVADPINGEIFTSPQILPGGKTVLVQASNPYDTSASRIEVITLADHRSKVLVRGGTSPHYLATSNGSTSNGMGHLLYNNKATLFAVPFDPGKLETQGNAVPLVDDVAYGGQNGRAEVAFSSAPSGHGTLVYRKGSASSGRPQSTIRWIDPSGKRETLTGKVGDYTVIRFSPDGKRLAVEVRETGQDIWVYEPQRDTWTRLTSGGTFYIEPVWSPDGRYIVFGSFGAGMFWTRSDGAGQPQPLTQGSGSVVRYPVSFAPDGKRLAYVEVKEGTNAAQIWTLPIEDSNGQLKAGTPERFLYTKFSDSTPMFSPDGHWLAYWSDESGKREVYVRAFPPSSGQAGKWQISNAGGDSPVWSRGVSGNSRDLLYDAGDQIMAVSYTVKGDTFIPDKPRVWVAKPGTNWDLHPDGKRIAIVTPVVTSGTTPETPKADHEVVFLENFYDELRRRAPVK